MVNHKEEVGLLLLVASGLFALSYSLQASILTTSYSLGLSAGQVGLIGVLIVIIAIFRSYF